METSPLSTKLLGVKVVWESGIEVFVITLNQKGLGGAKRTIRSLKDGD